MKRLLASAALFSFLFGFGGCALFMKEAASRDIVKPYILSGESDDGVTAASPSLYIGEMCAGAVVSIVSSCYVRDGRQTLQYENYYSGIVLNDDGYVLTVSAVGSVSVEEEVFEASSVCAKLAPVYEDDTKYTLKEVDVDEESGLALYRFYDRFSYMDGDGERRSGLQFTATLSSEDVATGNRCWAVGNCLGDLFTGSGDLTMTGGVISDSATDENIFSLKLGDVPYSYLQATVPTTPEMTGGALFDENGYVIGMAASKIVSESGGAYQYLDKSALFYKTDILADYVNTVSEKLQTVIRLSVAEIAEEAAA